MKQLSLHEQIVARLKDVREYRESEALLQVLGLLELLECSYKEQLADVAAEDLQRIQGALRQVKSLRSAIFLDGGDVPLL